MAEPQQVPGMPEGWHFEDTPPAPRQPSAGHDFKVLGINVHVPGEEKPRADSAMVSGVPGIGTLNPEDALFATQIARKAVAAGPGFIGRIIAGAQEASPMVKYEAVKTGLHYMGVPEPAAAIIAQAASGYRRGGKAPAAAAAPVTEAQAAPRGPVESPLELTNRVKAEYRAKNGIAPDAQHPGPPTLTSPAESVSGGTAPPTRPPVSPALVESPATAPRGNGLPDQKALNEKALARRRAEYQARQAAAAQQTPPSSPPEQKLKLTADESKAYLAMRVAGKTDAQAKQAIEASRALNQSLGLKIPTKSETKFPKGNRGGPPKDE